MTIRLQGDQLLARAASSDWEATIVREMQQAADPALSQVYAALIIPHRTIYALLTLFDDTASRRTPLPLFDHHQ
jgi:hypothetical protein